MSLFVDLASGANSSKVLVQLPCCHTLLTHHTPEHFPFLRLHENRHLRSQLQQTLAKLIFMQAVDIMEGNFNSFMEPILQVLSELASLQPAQMRSDNRVREALQGSCRDIRGICSAATSKKAYLMLLKTISNHLSFFARCVEVFRDDSDVITAVFKCMTEVVTNKSQRATFGNHSAQGILLFRESSAVAHAFASASPPTLAPGADIYKERYKGVACCLNTLKESLSGNYVNFGVMTLYGDTALILALDASLTLLLSLESMDDALTYPKLSLSYFAMLELMFNDHMSYMAQKDNGTFMKILEVLVGGLQCDTPISTLAAQTIDHITSDLVLHRDASSNSVEEEQTVGSLRMHVMSNPRLLPDLLAKLFELLLFGTLGNHWAVTRPVLSLLIADETTFLSYRQHLVSTQSPDKQARLEECFDRLLMGLDHSLDIANRDRFAQRLANFRQQVREFLTL
jgi:exportin-7